ncbi:MAG: ABA4-like family protein [Gemmatimonadales bacterium]|nr:ABA4-like family protein [Gemmatimonadales bacterium]
MTNEQLFSIANTTALLGWIALALAPARTVRLVRWAIPGALAVLYVALIIRSLGGGGGEGGFDTLANVKRLFANDGALLAGWVHYLAFDLFTGTWEVRDAQALGIPHLAVVPCLLLTFLFGPAGWLLYAVLRGTWTWRRRSTEAGAAVA